MNTRDDRSSHDRRGDPVPCQASARAACSARLTARLRRRQLASLATATADSAHSRPRCPALRSRPGYLADLGSCWYSRVAWTPVVWRLEAPRRRAD